MIAAIVKATAQVSATRIIRFSIGIRFRQRSAVLRTPKRSPDDRLPKGLLVLGFTVFVKRQARRRYATTPQPIAANAKRTPHAQCGPDVAREAAPRSLCTRPDCRMWNPSGIGTYALLVRPGPPFIQRTSVMESS
jgi:hypothetical protein